MRLRQRMPVVLAMIVLGALASAGAAGAAPDGRPPVTQVVDALGNATPQRGMHLSAQSDLAQIVDVSPSSEGMPGADLIRRLLSWLAQLALWGSLGSILAGATVYGISQNSASYNSAYRGKQLAVAGAIGAALAGLAPTAISMLFSAAGG